MGIKNVELLNQAHCDIATIGNNEGMTISHDALNTLYDNAEFDVTCANVLTNRVTYLEILHHQSSKRLKV